MMTPAIGAVTHRAPTIADRLAVPCVLGDLIKLGLAGLTLPAAWWIVGRRS
jgi:hypothetical protein